MSGEIVVDGWEQIGEQVVASYSGLQLHRRCPQAWYYRYGEGIRQPETGAQPYLHFGSWWSALRAAEALERGRRFDSLLQEPGVLKTVDGGPTFSMRDVEPVDILEAADAWWKRQSTDTKDVWVATLGEGLDDRLRGAFERWVARWSEDRKHERPLAVEAFWKRMLPRPESDSRWGDISQMPAVILLGYIDEILFDERKGMTVVRDGKSRKDLGNVSALGDLMDSQLQLYAWGITPTLARWGAQPVRAAEFDSIRSVAPKEPQLTASGNLSKAVTQYDLQSYLDWASGDDGQGVPWGTEGEFVKTGKNAGTPKFGRYVAEDKEIERLSTPAWLNRWHLRSFTPLSQNIVRTHLRAAVDGATDIWRTTLRTDLTREAQRNITTWGCQNCDFATLCRAQMFGGADGQYELAEHGLVARDGRRMLEPIA